MCLTECHETLTLIILKFGWNGIKYEGNALKAK